MVIKTGPLLLPVIIPVAGSDQLDDLDRRIKKLDAMIVTLCRTNETCRRLAKLPGVGPIIATAIVGSVNMAVSFARAARWQPGSGWCPGSIQLAASHGSAASDDAPTTISGAS
jgi:transposase